MDEGALARAMHEGVAHYGARRLDRAAACFDAVLASDPSHADALHLRGLVAHRAGDPAGALAFMDRAIAADPEHGPALTNRALPLRALGRLDEAAATLDRALALQAASPQARTLRAQVALALGDAPEAVRHATRAAGEAPDRPDANAILGQALLATGAVAPAVRPLERAAGAGHLGALLALAEALVRLGRAEEAQDRLRALPRALPPPVLAAVGEAQLRAGDLDGGRGRLEAALAVDPDLATARAGLARLLRDSGRAEEALALLDAAPDALHNLRGTVLLSLGRHRAALAELETAVRDDPGDGSAHHNLAVARFGAGDRRGALEAHLAALEVDPDDHERWIALSDTLDRMVGLPDALEPWVTRGLAVEGVGHQGLESAARQLVSRWPDVAAASAADDVDDDLIGALDHPLVHAWWRRTRVQTPVWERRLTALRRAGLLSGALDAHPELAVSLAIQAWHAGHAWWEEPDEAKAVAGLAPADPTAWARLAAYRPLPADLPAPTHPALAELHRIVVAEPAEERRLGAALPALGLTDDGVSIDVRAQYEDHPYPRLVSVHRKPPLPLARLLRAAVPAWSDPPDVSEPRVLIAGCGTGQQVLTAATRYAGARLLAVDLSRASLGVAARQVRAWGLDDRVRLAQADILALGDLDERFDVIECGGVLHHLADPLSGWRILVGLLAPGGVMKIGLYSEIARADVVAARALVEHHGTSTEGLRRARRQILDLPEAHPARRVVWSPDFPSLAGFRDLVLHRCEHRFTLAQLGQALDELGLELVGFQHPDPRAAERYRARWPDDTVQRDLDRWAALEADHPETFAGMFQFWCRSIS